ncbi:glycosyltransferase [Pantanalinema sp. GBBB05]|uniref:glycosyltransferase n=1 Tax=Pantanalinema sp. GBBB05 TaxID=2604139 RepID=UPI001D2E3F21|nr:glycosyltransferase [Pantanalinema sp. GBBB05]
MIAFQILLVVLIFGAAAFYIACGLCIYQFAEERQVILRDPDYEPGISLLVPACGVDTGAWENWLSLCKQDYPDYEVLFGVTHPHDPAIPILQQLATAFPGHVRVFTHLEPRGINYKDSNLSYLLEVARHEIIVFADSDIRVSPDYLATVTAPLADPNVGLVTCCFLGHQPQFLGAALASLGRCVDFIPSALIARTLDRGLRFAVGATIATRKSTLADFGGLHLNRIGSDYNLGKRATLAGYRIKLSNYVLESDTGSESLADLFKRELRWNRTIRFNRGRIYYAQIFCHGLPFALLLLLVTGWQPWAIAISLSIVLIRYAEALMAIVSLNSPRLLPWLWVLPLRDFLSLVVWGMGAFGDRVYWRGRRLRIEADGLLQPIE